MEQYKKYVIFAIVVVFLAIISSKGYKYIKEQKKSLKNDIEQLKKDKVILKDSIIYFKTKEKELNTIEKTYYNEYITEYNRRIKAEKQLNDIRYLVFSRHYLDSLAKHITY